MKKLIIGFILFVLFDFSINLNAQNYKTALGISTDFGEGWTLAGPSLKNYFTKYSYTNVEALFYQNITFFGAYYFYNRPLSIENKLNYYVGGGPAISLADKQAEYWIRPILGLEYNIKPVAINVEWRPALLFYDLSDCLTKRLGAGLKYCF